MRRSSAAVLGAVAGLFAGAAFLRRRAAPRERVDLYFEDGSMVSLADGSPDAARLIPLARDVLRRAS
jgi:hypothetical protein